jgi:hypothetical protein
MEFFESVKENISSNADGRLGLLAIALAALYDHA